MENKKSQFLLFLLELAPHPQRYKGLIHQSLKSLITLSTVKWGHWPAVHPSLNVRVHDCLGNLKSLAKLTARRGKKQKPKQKGKNICRRSSLLAQKRVKAKKRFTLKSHTQTKQEGERRLESLALAATRLGNTAQLRTVVDV